MNWIRAIDAILHRWRCDILDWFYDCKAAIRTKTSFSFLLIGGCRGKCPNDSRINYFLKCWIYRGMIQISEYFLFCHLQISMIRLFDKYKHEERIHVQYSIWWKEREKGAAKEIPRNDASIRHWIMEWKSTGDKNEDASNRKRNECHRRYKRNRHNKWINKEWWRWCICLCLFWWTSSKVHFHLIFSHYSIYSSLFIHLCLFTFRSVSSVSFISCYSNFFSLFCNSY